MKGRDMMAGERRSPWFTGLMIAMALLCLMGLALLIGGSLTQGPLPRPGMPRVAQWLPHG